MFNAIDIATMSAPALEALSGAIERAITVMGAGSAAALTLAGLVLGVEALANRRRKAKVRRPPAHRPSRMRRREAYR